MSKSPEQLWKSMDALFLSILNENHTLKAAMRRAVDTIQKLENDPDFGNAWDAQAILRSALGGKPDVRP